MATGDFHTLVVCETFKDQDNENSVNTNVGDTDIISFGLNQYGQINGTPSEKSVLEPRIIPFFIGKSPKIVSACRSRSVCMTEDGKVYEWGFVGSEKRQFNILHDFSQTDSEVPVEIIDIKCGLEYTIFLSKNGKVFIIGTISQVGNIIFESEDISELNGQFGNSEAPDYTPDYAKSFMKSRMQEKGQCEDKKQTEIVVAKIDAGNSHAMFLDTEGAVYVLGAGHYGQLGLGFDTIRVNKPSVLQELNDGFDKITSIS